MADVSNYDLRVDYAPYEGGLVSVSYFKKDIENPIEYVQRVAEYVYTTPANYPEGELSGFEFELRQDMGRLWEKLEGLTLAGNATIIESEVTLPDEEAARFAAPNLMVPMTRRDMTGAPDRLYNLFLIYDMDRIGLPGTQASLSYTVRGDALVAGAGQAAGHFIPDVYETSFGTLNLTVQQKIGERCTLKFQVKNLLDPDIETVYRSKYIGGDVTKTSYRRGREFSIGIAITF
jgi:outer membrane receptor protein involved in Fe transport